jgi:carbonic anhydrase
LALILHDIQMATPTTMKLSRALVPCVFMLGALAASQAGAAPPHWEYGGAHGAPHWGELDAAYESCARGHAQSPIDIRGAQTATLPALNFSYAQFAPAIVNNGHTIQVNVPKGQFLEIGGRRLELLQFHFHTPSEERISGKATAMVAHLVHRDAEGRLGVVAVLLQPGAPNPALDPVLAHLPRRAGETVTVEGLEIDLAKLLPARRSYYDFEGSLTTPPCSEGVHWMVMAQPMTVSPQAIKAFRRLYPANARPVQPLNGRTVRLAS